jgi:hypothetical protein
VISIGWAIALLPIIIVLIVGTYKFCTARGKFTRRWRDLLNPEGDWGPALAVHRAEQFPMQIPEARKLMPYADIYYSGIVWFKFCFSIAFLFLFSS